MENTEKIPVLVYTDIGRDPDDLEAVLYLAGCQNIDIVGIATTSMIPDRRANIAKTVCDGLGLTEVPIGVGSVSPLGKEDAQVETYVREHSVGGVSYEGRGLIDCFVPSTTLITNAIRSYRERLIIAALAPLTDIAKVALQSPDVFSTIGGLYIQGQATINGDALYADPTAYNLREDMAAAEVVLAMQDDIAMTFIGKYAAYQIPFTRLDFEDFTRTGNAIGNYLETHALQGLICLADRSPEILKEIFDVSADELHLLEEISMPYDAVVAKAIANPTGLVFETHGRHRLVGMTATAHGIENREIVKQDIKSTIQGALVR